MIGFSRLRGNRLTIFAAWECSVNGSLHVSVSALWHNKHSRDNELTTRMCCAFLLTRVWLMLHSSDAQ